MAYVVIVSLPLVFVCILASIGCYYMGRHKGQQEGREMVNQELGINGPHPPTSLPLPLVMPTGVAPPHPSPHQFSSAPPYNPNQPYLKPQNGMLV
ncbi:hypothetical protein Dsin_028388 [Dipteronia sinensis]|uniref:Uncharacterized protein n=1 Tax=Dipteronia sinensis TaxID=43782 RepID=A0AAD9ZRR1_9ROSI|nr:hypothetical protein Dsin_028388 [Dipteronia sinensis]